METPSNATKTLSNSLSGHNIQIFQVISQFIVHFLLAFACVIYFKLNASKLFKNTQIIHKASLLSGNLILSKNAIIASSIIGFLVVVICLGTGLSLGLARASYGQSCSLIKPCLSIENTICDLQLNTSSNYVCKCDTLKYWNKDKCLNRVSINETCTSTTHCLEEKNLECINLICSCNPLKGVWSLSSENCQLKKSFNETCSLSSECNDNLNLLCSSSVCTCNLTQFWNGNSCENKRLFNETCLSTDWCNTQVNRLSCVQQTWSMETNVGFCKCNSSQFYNTLSSTCVTLLSYAQNGCTLNSQCNYNVNLSCVSGTCTCATSEYYDGTKCLIKVNHGSSCHQLSFSGSLYPKCLDTIGLVCASNTCQCNTTQFWSTIQARCINKLSSGGQCTVTNDCDTAKSLQCISGFCQCTHVQYYSASGCVNKLSLGASCSSDIQCNNNSVLTCSSGTCQCVTSPFIYWSVAWTTCIKIPSTILNSIEIDYLYTMVGMVSSHQPTLLYRASRDGMTSLAFHSRCDGIPNTITIILNSNNFVYGGYTSNTWDSVSACKHDSSAFIFNLRRNGASNYEKIGVSISSCAIRAIGAYGPIFGYDDILVDYRVRFSFDGWCSFCNAYPCPSGVSNGLNSYIHLCGGSSWGYYFGDYEVWRV